MNVGMLLSSHARFRPEHTAVVFENKRLTFKEFNTRVNKCANALLAMGVRKGDKVATLLPNSLELLEIYWACPKIGAVIVPLSTLLMDKGIISLLRDSESKVLVTSAQFVPIVQRISDDLPDIPPSNYVIVDWARSTPYRDYRTMVDEASEGEPPPIEVRDEDPFNIMYTSGTTGLPKGIVHTHYVRAMYCMTFASCFRMTPESVVLHAGSIVFNGAFVTLMPAMFLGATYVLLRQFEPSQFIESIQREKATHVVMVPSQIVAMLRAPNFSIEALQSLEMICSLGAPLHREYKEELHRKLPGRFYELYGLTEGFITVLDRTVAPHRVDSVGSPTFFSEMRIVDERGNDLPPFQVGEIIGRGPMLMPGYYKRPDLTAEAIREGWLYTGDLGYVDEDGFSAEWTIPARMALRGRARKSRERRFSRRDALCASAWQGRTSAEAFHFHPLMTQEPGWRTGHMPRSTHAFLPGVRGLPLRGGPSRGELALRGKGRMRCEAGLLRMDALCASGGIGASACPCMASRTSSPSPRSRSHIFSRPWAGP
jgi:long-chain acyl-CoA synthetase